jgi:hypothetical protein
MKHYYHYIAENYRTSVICHKQGRRTYLVFMTEQNCRQVCCAKNVFRELILLMQRRNERLSLCLPSLKAVEVYGS